MIKYSVRFFLLSVLALVFTSSTGMEITGLETEEDAAFNVTSDMAIKNSVSGKNVSYESNFFESSSEASIMSEGSIKKGPFKGCAFKQEIFPFVAKKYSAECFIEGCSKKF